LEFELLLVLLLLLVLVLVFVLELLFILVFVTVGDPELTFDEFPEFDEVETFPPFEVAVLVFELLLEEAADEPPVGILLIVTVEDPVLDSDPLPFPVIVIDPVPVFVAEPVLPPTLTTVAPFVDVPTDPFPFKAPAPDVLLVPEPEVPFTCVEPDPEVAAAPTPPLFTLTPVCPLFASDALLFPKFPWLPEFVAVAELAFPVVAFATEAPEFVEFVAVPF